VKPSRIGIASCVLFGVAFCLLVIFGAEVFGLRGPWHPGRPTVEEMAVGVVVVLCGPAGIAVAVTGLAVGIVGVWLADSAKMTAKVGIFLNALCLLVVGWFLWMRFIR
jgi:hypothetical protein